MSEVMYPDVKERRDILRDEAKCINGPMVGNVGIRGVEHGPVVSGGKCQRCLDVHRGPKLDTLSVACPRCESLAGEPCRSVEWGAEARELKASHFERYVAARRSAS